MTPEQEQKFESMQRKVDEIYEYVQRAKSGTLPLDDNKRILSGIGFIGRTTDTTPGGAIIVNTPEGPMKLLRV